jgi:hypothetical protein
MQREGINRRALFAGLGASILAAPAIVRIASLMPVKSSLIQVKALPLIEISAFRMIDASGNES